MKKDSIIRENLNKVLSQKEDPSKVENIMNKIIGGDGPIDDRSIPDRLWVLWTRIKEMRTEAEDLTCLLKYHSGSRLSQVVDVLKQAEELTSETMSETTGQTPSEEFRISDRGDHWEIWNDSVGVGIRFKKWDENSGRHLLYVRSGRSLVSEDDETIDKTFEELISFAESRFPQEFGSQD